MALPKDTSPELADQRQKAKGFSYYTEENAKALQGVVDAMMKDGIPRKFTKAKYKREVETLLKMIGRGFLYLADHLDPDGKYRKFRKRVVIHRDDANEAVILYFKFKHVDTYTTGVEKIDERKHKPERAATDWQTPLDEFIESGKKGQTLRIDHLWLDAEKQIAVRAGLAGLAGLIEVVEVSQERIIVTKMVD